MSTLQATQTRTGARTGLPITIRGLRKNFGARTVLRGIDLTVPAGQFLAIVGRNGCGKSTLLRILAGLDEPSAGSFWFGEARDSAPPREDLRIMFQEPRLLPWTTVAANVEVGFRAGKGARDVATEALAAVGLAERGDAWPSVLSGGQKQRVALARALVSGPKFLALDEPLGALDALTRIEMQRLVEQVWLRQGFTAVLVTHDVSEALTLADRVVILDEGTIALDVEVPFPRPREPGNHGLAGLERDILARLLGSAPTQTREVA
jgi:sulfonate transport system ATP-binding protein